jgi:putative transposase
VGHQVIREYIYALTAVSPADGQVTSLVMPWVDTETMSVFLRHTARRFRGDLCVMLDSAGLHRANALSIPQTIPLIPLPPYSPELNPVEHLWDYLRDHPFDNSTFHSLHQVEKALCRGLKALNGAFSPEPPCDQLALVRVYTNDRD